MTISILGTGMTKFGELWDESPRQLARQALQLALKNSHLKPSQIDAIFVGNMLAGILGNQANVGSLFAEELGEFVPAFRLEAACASGGSALHAGIQSLLSGQYAKVLVLGVEKMTDHSNDEVTSALMAAASDEERSSGVTFPGLYALMANAYMQEYLISEELLAGPSIKNHYHGSLNAKAQFQSPITLEQIMKSPLIADPLRLLECSPISDGAAAVVLTSETNVYKYHKKPIKILASEIATDTLSLSDRTTYTSLQAVKQAAEVAYKKAKVTPQDIDVAEIHDCFSIAEIIAVEDLGFSKKGKGVQDIMDGKMTLGSSTTVVNPSGGLKACGHPVGATGVKQIVEVSEQLRGEAGRRQVKNARIGLTHNVGGTGTIAVIHVLKA